MKSNEAYFNFNVKHGRKSKNLQNVVKALREFIIFRIRNHLAKSIAARHKIEMAY